MPLIVLMVLACSQAGKWGTPGLENYDDTADSGVGDDSGDSGDVDAPRLVITEIMKDPDAVSDDVGEWFEITNTGDAAADLDGLWVAGPDGDGLIVSGALIIEAGDVLVFGSSDDTASNGGYTPDYAYEVADLKLSNEGGSLTLSLDGVTIDSVTWDELPDDKGHAISLSPEATDADANDLPESWCSASTAYGLGDYGTPGEANEACSAAPSDADGDGVSDDEDCDPDDADIYAGAPELDDGKDNDCDDWTDERAPGEGDLVITEIMDDTDPTEDDYGEWFELTNDTDVPLELAGLTVSDLGDESFTLDEAVILEPGALLVFGASDDEDLNGGYTPDLLFDQALFHLGNDEDEIVLTLDGVLIDEVDYDSDFPHEKGKSRSLDPGEVGATKNDDPDNWCEGDGRYGTDDNQGTPGEVNDDC